MDREASEQRTLFFALCESSFASPCTGGGEQTLLDTSRGALKSASPTTTNMLKSNMVTQATLFQTGGRPRKETRNNSATLPAGERCVEGMMWEESGGRGNLQTCEREVFFANFGRHTRKLGAVQCGARGEREQCLWHGRSGERGLKMNYEYGWGRGKEKERDLWSVGLLLLFTCFFFTLFVFLLFIPDLIVFFSFHLGIPV